jgi:hypothetical protein
MTIPFGVSINPVAQADFGLVALDDHDRNFFIDALAIVTFGFLIGNFWAYCDTDATTTWTAVADETTTWTPIADESTVWSICT